MKKILSLVLALCLVFGMLPAVSAAETPVYTRVEITKASDLTSGTYLIYGTSSQVTDDGTVSAFMTAAGSTSTRLKSVQLKIDDDSVATDDTACVWKLIQANGGFYIQNAETGKYLYYGSNTGNSIYQTTAVTIGGIWSLVKNNNGWTLEENASGRQLSCNRFGSEGSYYLGFATYQTDSTTLRSLAFYKLEGEEVTPPDPTEPEPTESEPTEPNPTEPKPTEPNPSEPKPTEPEPTEPEPTQPEPTEPEPTDPDPTESTEPLENITWRFDEDGGILILSGSGEMTAPEGGYPWLEYADQITAIAFGKDLTHIGDYAFMGCTALTEVLIPATVEYIGYGPFMGCTGLKSATISGKHYDYLGRTFEDCTALTAVTLKGTVDQLEDTFRNCTALKSIVLPEGVKEMRYTFYGCTSLETVNIPSTVTYMDGTFGDCDALESVELPEGLETLREYVFGGCVDMKAVTIPSTVTWVSDSCFAGGYDANDVWQNGIETVIFLGDAPEFSSHTFKSGHFSKEIDVYYPADNETWTEEVMQPYGGNPNWISYKPGGIPEEPTDPYDGTCGTNAYWRFDGETGKLTIFGTGQMFDYDSNEPRAPWYDHRLDITAVVVEEGITAIGEYAFGFHYKDLKQLTLPSTLTAIGNHAFQSSAIEKLELPEGLISIGSSAFVYTPITTLVLPDSVTTIGDSAFQECEKLTKVVLPKGLKTCGNHVFQSCIALKDVTMPKMPDLEWMGNYTFCGTAITDLSWFKGNTISYMMFSGAPLTKVVIPYCVTELHDFAFSGCTQMTEITIHAGVESIGSCAFSGCKSLKKVYFEGDAPEIGVTIFQNLDQTITCYYPRGNATWTSEVRSELGENVKWVAYTPKDRPDPSSPFTDVKSTDYFYQPVLWAVEEGITSGLSATKFGPHNPCTRGQIVTFLWAASGRPEPASDENPFTDVKASDYFYKAVLWAVENGITSGMSPTEFGPNRTCTRGQVVTFLWAAKDRPEPENTDNTFTDVKETDYYYKAVLWAVENGITSGVGAGKFGPSNVCTRGQIVTFLHKAFAQS